MFPVLERLQRSVWCLSPVRGWQPPRKVKYICKPLQQNSIWYNQVDCCETDATRTGSKSSTAMAADHGLSSVELVILIIFFFPFHEQCEIVWGKAKHFSVIHKIRPICYVIIFVISFFANHKVCPIARVQLNIYPRACWHIRIQTYPLPFHLHIFSEVNEQQ